MRTGNRHDFRTLRDSEFCLTPGDNLWGLSARHKYGFPFHRLRYVETIEDASKMHTAHAPFSRVGIDDRSGVQESMLEGVNRADIRLWSAAACSHRPMIRRTELAGTTEGSTPVSFPSRINFVGR